MAAQDTPAHSVNVPLLRKVLEHVTAHPKEWDQKTWASKTTCGTSFCIAGHTVVHEGHEVAWDEEVEGLTQGLDVVDGGEIPVVAARALGIDFRGYRDAHTPGHLFYVGNDLRTVWTIASKLTDGEIEVPADLPGGTS